MNWKRLEKDIEAYSRFLFYAYFILLIGGVIFSIMGLPIYSYFHISEEVRCKCFKYIDHEHCDYPMFKELKDLKAYSEQHPELCYNKDTVIKTEGMQIRNETIKVELLEDENDSVYVKIKYRDLLFKKEYYTMKCYIDKYAPEDFIF